MCGATDAVSMIEAPLEKNADLSYVQINILKNVAKMASTAGGIRTDYIGTYCLDRLGL